jgi:hypothetical protein
VSEGIWPDCNKITPVNISRWHQKVRTIDF